jgi:hypothetical protein
MSHTHDVFISYNRADRDRVRLLREEMRRLGLSVWMDEEIEPGTEFQRKIERALHDSGCIVVAWTQGSVASDWVRAEATAGFNRQRLLSVRLDDVQVPLPFNIHDVVDLTDWPSNRQSDDKDLQRLLGRITALLGKKATARQPPTKDENLSVRLARRVLQAISQPRVIRREIRLRSRLPAGAYAKLTRTNALIDQLSHGSLHEASTLAAGLVTDLPNLDDAWIGLVRSRYLARFLDEQRTAEYAALDALAQPSDKSDLITAFTSGDPMQCDTVLSERMAAPDDQLLHLYALYVLFPARLSEIGQEFLTAAESVNPLSAELKFHLARGHSWLGNWGRCLTGLQDTLRMSPDAELVVIYLILVSIKIGSYELAGTHLNLLGDAFPEPMRDILDRLVTDRLSDRAGLVKDRIDVALATLKSPSLSLAEILSHAEQDSVGPRPLPDRWVFDVAKRAEAWLKSVV